VLDQFRLEDEHAAPLRAALGAFAAGCAPAFAEATLAARRAYLRHWARSEVAEQRRLYTTLKALVLIPAYGLPELQRAVGAAG
jgi:hypothetical protein